MEIKLGGILGITFVSIILSSAVSGFDTIIGNFQKVQQHPELMQCAANVLPENEHVGVRIAQQEITCQALPRSWGEGEAMESGYVFAKKVFVQENFHPPLKVKHVYWEIPGVLETGAKLDVFITFSDKSSFTITLTDFLGEVIPDKGYQFEMWFSSLDIVVTFDRIGSQTYSSLLKRYWSKWSIKSGATRMLKISLLVQTDSVQVLVNDVQRFTNPLKKHLDAMKQISVVDGDNPLKDQVLIDRFQFTSL